MKTGQALPLRADLAGREAYGAPMPDVPVRLNVNENPYPPSPALVRAIAVAVTAVAGTLNRYPDRDAAGLRDDLAGYLGHGLTRPQVWAANGSNEVMLQLLLAFGGPGRAALGFEPSYSMHPIITQTTGTRWLPGARDGGDDGFGLDPGRAVAAVRELQPDLVFLTSPNNPTGTAMPLSVIEEVCEAAPGMVVVDEAYAEFARDQRSSALDLLPRHERLVVTRTMSKAFAMAGARIGYLAASPAVVRRPADRAAALSPVRDHPGGGPGGARAHGRAAGHGGRAARRNVTTWCDGCGCRGLAAADSDANFVLFGRFGDRHAVWQGLLDRGVLIREVGTAGLAAGERRHGGGDGRVPGRAGRGARSDR